jgi:hypothetical protein
MSAEEEEEKEETKIDDICQGQKSRSERDIDKPLLMRT